MALSENVEESINGIDFLIELNNQISGILLESLNLSKDRLLIAERISLFFEKYVRELKRMISGTDSDLSFWASTLIVHYDIDYPAAEKKMTEVILSGPLEKAITATTILYRKRKPYLKSAILVRLEDINLTEMARHFFNENLNDINKW